MSVELIRLNHRRSLTIALLGALFFSMGVALANGPQTSGPDETSRAIALYQAGSNEEAINALRAVVKRNKNDLYGWHYLGLAWETKGDMKEARKAHEKAAKLADQLVENHVDQALTQADYLKALAPIRNQLALAEKSALRYVALTPTLSRSKREEWNLRTNLFQDLADVDNPDSGIGKVYRPGEVTEKARLLSKPEPPYTEEARNRGISGTVVLKVIFAAHGRVIGIRAVSGLPYGLTMNAISAARKIKFTPAIKDGKPVSMYAQLEYTFTVWSK